MIPEVLDIAVRVGQNWKGREPQMTDTPIDKDTHLDKLTGRESKPTSYGTRIGTVACETYHLQNPAAQF